MLMFRNLLLFICCIGAKGFAENSFRVTSQAILFRGGPVPGIIEAARKEYTGQLQSARIPELSVREVSPEGLQRLCDAFPETRHLSLAASPGISGLEALKSLPGLRFLHLGMLPQLRDWSSLRELPQLQTLSLQALPLESLDFTTGLPALQNLILNLPDLKDFSALQRLSHLETLKISGMRPEDLSFLAGLKNLRNLDLACPAVENLSAVGQLQRLEILQLDCGPDRKVSVDLLFLAGLTQLRQLQLKNMTVTGLEPLAGLTKLVYLNLSGCQGLLSLEPLRHLPELRSLSLPANTFSPEQLKVLRRGISINFITPPEPADKPQQERNPHAPIQ